jgi:hypothetical protein
MTLPRKITQSLACIDEFEVRWQGLFITDEETIMPSTLKALLLCTAVAPLFLAAEAMAQCPELQGDYLCRANGQEATTRILQSTRRGVTTYTIESDNLDLEVIADGKRHRTTIPNDSVQNASYVATCSRGNRLNVETRADLIVNGTNMGRSLTTFRMTQNSSGRVRTVTTVQLGNRTFPSITADCRKI